MVTSTNTMMIISLLKMLRDNPRILTTLLDNIIKSLEADVENERE